MKLLPVCLLFAMVIAVQARAVMLGEGECYSVILGDNSTAQVCAPSCSAINASSCQSYINESLASYTSDLRDKCMSYENLSGQVSGLGVDIKRYINESYSTLGPGFIDECNRNKNASAKWQLAYGECDRRLSALADYEKKMGEMNQSLDTCMYDRRSFGDELTGLKVKAGQMESTWWTGTGIAVILALAAYWFFFVRKKRLEAISDENIYEPSEEA